MYIFKIFHVLYLLKRNLQMYEAYTKQLLYNTPMSKIKVTNLQSVKIDELVTVLTGNLTHK